MNSVYMFCYFCQCWKISLVLTRVIGQKNNIYWYIQCLYFRNNFILCVEDCYSNNYLKNIKESYQKTLNFLNKPYKWNFVERDDKRLKKINWYQHTLKLIKWSALKSISNEIRSWHSYHYVWTLSEILYTNFFEVLCLGCV